MDKDKIIRICSMRVDIPNEIINYIMMFRTKDRIFLLFKNYFVFYTDLESKGNYLKKYCYDVSFHEWYFCIVKKRKHIKNAVLQSQ